MIVFDFIPISFLARKKIFRIMISAIRYRLEMDFVDILIFLKRKLNIQNCRTNIDFHSQIR